MKVVFMYHNIGQENDVYTVSCDAFARQMDAVCHSKILPDVVVTFDDGYKGSFVYGVEGVLKKGIKGVFFIVTRAVGGRLEGRECMSREDINELLSVGGIVGAHGLTHKPLNTPELLKYEAIESKKILQDIVQREVDLFAIPKGAMISLDAAEEVLREAGYKQVFISRPGIYDGRGFFVPRFCIKKTDPLWVVKGLAERNPFFIGLKKAEYLLARSAKALIGEGAYDGLKERIWQ